MKKILAISGGVDSMVMLDILTKKYSRDIYHGTNMQKNDYSFGDIIVAHFDHGVRDNSLEDALFVKTIAKDVYHIWYISEKGNLGHTASEGQAREARYGFLRAAAEKYGGQIYTAHHLDDLVETVIINLLRGTGWRGLACLDMQGVYRPFLEAVDIYEPMDKATILEYAAKRGLRFREDQSNSEMKYFRNRVRERLGEYSLEWEEKMELWNLWRRQKELKHEIDSIIRQMLPSRGEKWQRKWFRELDSDEGGRKVALELLRAGLLEAGVKMTRPQLEDFRQAILTSRPGKYFNLPKGRMVRLEKDEFII